VQQLPGSYLLHEEVSALVLVDLLLDSLAYVSLKYTSQGRGGKGG
jgi:hypothetical protein